MGTWAFDINQERPAGHQVSRSVPIPPSWDVGPGVAWAPHNTRPYTLNYCLVEIVHWKRWDRNREKEGEIDMRGKEKTNKKQK